MFKFIMHGYYFRGVSNKNLLCCSVFSLGGNVNTRQMLKPIYMGSIFHVKKSIKYSGHRQLFCQLLSNYQNLMLLTSSDTKRTLRHLFLFTNSVQRELVLICKQQTHLQLTFLALHSCRQD